MTHLPGNGPGQDGPVREPGELERTLSSSHRKLQAQGIPWMFGVVALGLMHLVPPLLPFALAAGVVAFPVLTIAHAVVLRLALVNPARRAFRNQVDRRIITRWTCRLGYLAIAPPAYATLAVPGLSAIVAPLAYFALNLGVYRYLVWQARRHSQGVGTHALEKVALGVVAIVAALGIVAALAMALLLGILVDRLL